MRGSARSDLMHLESALAFTSTELSPGGFQNFCSWIDPEWIGQALMATGTATLRRRRLPAEQVIWLVLGMALMRDLPIVDVVDKLDLALPGGDGPVAPSAVAQARARLGDEALEWLFIRCGDAWAHGSAAAHPWRGLALYGVDGTTLRVPDSDDNRRFFGGPSAGKKGRGPSGYPMIRMAALMALRSHLIASASFGPYDEEYRYANDLWSSLPDNSLVLIDRLFFSANVLLPIVRDGKNRHWMIRAKSNLRWRVVEKLGESDEIVEFDVSSAARAKDPSLPRTFRARAIRYQRKGFRPQVLLTSLTDREIPASELVTLYHERWEIELGYDELKTEMLDREEAIRSRSPKAVRQELWGVLLAYNLVRLEMERVALAAGVEPTRISFVGALRFMRDQWFWLSGTRTPGAIPGHLRDMRERIKRLLLPLRRPDRSYPRAVKIKMSSYALNRRRRKGAPK